MGTENENSELWYQNSDGLWETIHNISSFSVEISEESAAKLAAALIPLGELEIVPRDSDK